MHRVSLQQPDSFKEFRDAARGLIAGEVMQHMGGQGLGASVAPSLGCGSCAPDSPTAE